MFSKLEDKLYADRLLENAKDALKNPSKIAEKNAFSLYGFWGSSLYIKYNEYLMFDDKTDYACVFDLIKTIIDKLLQQRFENAENDFDFMHGFSGTIYLLAEILRNDNKIFITFFDDFDYANTLMRFFTLSLMVLLAKLVLPMVFPEILQLLQ